MKYRIYWDDSENSEVKAEEVDAPNPATAIFLAGMQVARNGHGSGPLEVVRIQEPVWVEVDLL